MGKEQGIGGKSDQGYCTFTLHFQHIFLGVHQVSNMIVDRRFHQNCGVAEVVERTDSFSREKPSACSVQYKELTPDDNVTISFCGGLSRSQQQGCCDPCLILVIVSGLVNEGTWQN